MAREPMVAWSKEQGDRVRARREARGLTRDDIAALPGSPSSSSWDALEHARRPEFGERTVRKALAVLDRLEQGGGDDDDRTPPPVAAARSVVSVEEFEALKEQVMQQALLIAALRGDPEAIDLVGAASATKPAATADDDERGE